MPSPINRLDDVKTTLTIYDQTSHLTLLMIAILDIHWFLGMHGLHLNDHGVGKLALGFVKRIRSIRNSGSAKQKLKEVHSKISSF